MISFPPCHCNYCTKYKGFPMLWKLKENCFWLEIPKNGSFTIKTTHKTARRIPNPTPHKNETPLVIVRDPLSRFHSLFKHYCVERGWRFELGKKFFKRRKMNILSLNIKERLNFFIENLEYLTSAEDVHHFYTQVYFMNPKVFSNYEIVNLKNLTTYLNVPIRNRTPNIKVSMTEEQTKYIRAIYKEDYDFFDSNHINFK